MADARHFCLTACNKRFPLQGAPAAVDGVVVVASRQGLMAAARRRASKLSYFVGCSLRSTEA